MTTTLTPEMEFMFNNYADTVRDALHWCLMNQKGMHKMSKSDVNKIFGAPNGKVGKFLHDNLLIIMAGGLTMRFCVDIDGFRNVYNNFFGIDCVLINRDEMTPIQRQVIDEKIESRDQKIARLRKEQEKILTDMIRYSGLPPSVLLETFATNLRLPSDMRARLLQIEV